jgi:hypothetical protein
MDQSSFKSQWQVLFVFGFTFLGDVLTTLLFNNAYNFSWYFKGLLILFLLLKLLVFKPSILKYILVAFGLMYVGMILNYQNDIIPKTAQFFEYYSGILIFYFFIKSDSYKIIDKIILSVFLFYVINILIVTIFKIDYFKTYPTSQRFGYMPLFNAQNEFSFIMITILSYFYKKLSLTKNIINCFLFTISLLAACFVGTKIIYLFVFILINYLILKKLGRKFYVIFGIIFLIFNVLLKELWYNFLKNYFNSLVLVYEKNGILDAVSSLRLSHLENKIGCQSMSFKLVNYFFGGSNLDCITEMSLLDLFLFFGVIGFVWYFYLYKKLVLIRLKLDTFGYLLIISITFLSFLGGYYFENFSTQLYFISFLYLFYFDKENAFQNKVSAK